MPFFSLQIMITPFVLFLSLYYILLPITNSDYSFCVMFAILLCPSSDCKFWLLLLCYFCHCIMSFFRLHILITPFVLFLPLQHLLLPDTDSDYSFCVIFAIVLCPSSVYRFWLLLLCYFCHCSISFFRLQILITPFLLFLPLYYVLLPFTNYDYSFCVIFAIVLCPSSVYRSCLLLLCYFCHCSISFFRIQILITPLVLIMPLYYLLLPFTDYNYSFCVIFCHCIISFFRLQILITLFVLFLPLYYVLLLCTDPVYSFCVIFAIAASPSSEYRFWLLLCLIFAIVLCPSSFTDSNYSFCDILPLYYVLLLFIDPVYSFCVIFAIAASPSSGYRFWLLLLWYFCHCIMSFFRLKIMITPFVLCLPLFYVLLPLADSDYSFCVIFCHCIISFFRLQILITPFVLFMPLYYVVLLFTDSDYSFCCIFATAGSPSPGYRFWLLLLFYFCHCIMPFFSLQIKITRFVLFLPLYYVLLPFTHSDYSFWLIFAIAASPSFGYRFWLLLLCYFCHCIMSFFCLQILITPFVLFLPLQHLLLPVTDSDYSFCVIFAIVLCPSSVYKLWLLLLC